MKVKPLTVKQSTDFLCSRTMMNWAMMQEAMWSCAIEGITSTYLVKLYNGWLFDHNLNRQELSDLAVYMGYKNEEENC